MKGKVMKKRLTSALFILAIVSFTAKAEKNEAMTKSERETHAVAHDKMADAHKQMAECLRSDRPFQECRDAYAESCRANHEGGFCPMMDGQGKGRGHRGRGMRPSEEKPK